MVSNLQEYQGQVPSSKERQRIVNESGRDAVMFDLYTEAGKIRLWDLSDGTWTAPLEKDVAMNHYLKKMVYKCSACNKCSVDQNEVKRHIAQVKTAYERCSNAELMSTIGEFNIPSHTCSGCGTPMSMRKNQGQRHIDKIREQYQVHYIDLNEIDILLTHKYALSPSVLMPQQVVETIQTGVAKPDVQQASRNADEVIRKPRKRKRRRR